MKNNNLESALQFLNYSTKSFTFKRNNSFKTDSQEIEIRFKFNAEMKILDTNNEAILTLSCIIFDENFSNNTDPFYLEISLDGHFICIGNENINHFRVHSIAILLPYLRSQITSFTSQAGIHPIIIPTINVFSMFEENVTKNDTIESIKN